MKIVALILSVVVFSMAFTPCGGSICVDHHEDHPISTNHDHSEDGDDDCTPFCVCQCCGTSIVFPQIDRPTEVVVKPSASDSFYFAFQYEYKYTFGIWHPPTAS